MGKDSGVDCEGTVWRCELIAQSFTAWEFLCKLHVFAERKEEQRGQRVWMKVLPRSIIDASCARCDRVLQARLPDETGFMRSRRAAVWSPGLSRTVEGGRIVERIVGG